MGCGVDGLVSCPGLLVTHYSTHPTVSYRLSQRKVSVLWVRPEMLGSSFLQEQPSTMNSRHRRKNTPAILPWVGQLQDVYCLHSHFIDGTTRVQRSQGPLPTLPKVTQAGSFRASQLKAGGSPSANPCLHSLRYPRSLQRSPPGFCEHLS